MCAVTRGCSFFYFGVLLVLSSLDVEGTRALREAPTPSPSISQEAVLLNFANTVTNFQVIGFADSHSFPATNTERRNFRGCHMDMICS